ncbi:hypothetical protein PAXINDRAFT_70959 [Paxillus involutus ATCC 200175]|nr:hypothetical protein PAXINDRAFT_70959 [Paxillus involutus ATCC 200175]
MVHTIHALLEFCYIACHNIITDDSLDDLEDALHCFHKHREIFIETNVHDNFSLPRQHSLIHYSASICMFSVPNGLCLSITESKHVKAVKRPWRCSSKYKALLQMLLTNQRLDKLATSHVKFKARGMLDEPLAVSYACWFGEFHTRCSLILLTDH